MTLRRRTHRSLALLMLMFSALATAQTMDEAATAPGQDMAAGEGPMPEHGSMTHGDHNPKFGGLVLMYGVLHFEIVAKPSGRVELHLSDGMRAPMPALTVSDVTVEVEHKNGAYESVPMAVSDGGDFWYGAGGPMTDREDTTVHLAFLAFGEPYVYALPLKAVQADAGAPSDGNAMTMPGAANAR